jgi:cell division protein FtsL
MKKSRRGAVTKVGKNERKIYLAAIAAAALFIIAAVSLFYFLRR